MPKFTEQEKDAIRQSLLIKGKELFIKYGLVKTSIDEIVLACGIAKGSFYKFFASKEELYYSILIHEENVRDQLLQELLREDLPPKELISAFFHKSSQIVEDNPFLRLAFHDGEYERLIRKLPPQLIEASTKDNLQQGTYVIQSLMNRGIIRKENPEIVVGIIQAILMLQLSRDKIGADIFPTIMNHIIGYVAEGLTRQDLL
ncbi:DNA-binding transcriptional regulator EnvR [compost metagenome]